MSRLTHISHATLKSIAKLTQKKYRREERKFIIEGLRLVEEALRSDWRVEMLLVGDPILKKGDAARAMKSAREKKCAIYEVSSNEIEILSDTVTSQGILAVVSMKEYSLDRLWPEFPAQSLIVCFDGIADPGNAGTILRTCDWFGVNAVLMSRNSVEVYSPKVTRSAMGSIFHLPVIPEIDLPQTIRDGKEEGYKVFATVAERESEGKLRHSFPNGPFPSKSIVILGNEAHGVSEEVMRAADSRLSIPRFGKAESLNVAIACGVILGAARSYSAG